ncbi:MULTISPECIES: AraC family transcriptional regulator [Gordonia]|uniref:AraC family transcriptional regulator n=1 Tax=Gordonia TaxID=2053 RepID=UPI001EF6EDAD|nr:AraC family transcriptional regulator [Gordonia sp. McavH-238-E]MCG7631450.1 AraC family transcriptional regulator [Gordonia sp. McavH-238-E]
MTHTQTISNSLPGFSPEEGDFLWRRALQERLADLDLSGCHDHRGHGSFVGRDVGDVLITDWTSGTSLEGTRRSAVVGREAESLLVLTATAGTQFVETPDDTALLRPGSLLLMSSRTPVRIVVPEKTRKRTVRVPSAAFAGYDTGRGIPNFLSIDIAANPLAQLTAEFLDGIGSRLRQMTPADVESSRNALLVLLAGMIRSGHAPDAGETDFLPFLRGSLEDWIVAHLGDGPIRVGDVALAHSVAPRTVHRAFATTGDTMGSVVRAHRLAAARNDLVHTDSSIATIAHRWGFCDASHLGREFRREFSMSPGDYRAAHGIV